VVVADAAPLSRLAGGALVRHPGQGRAEYQKDRHDQAENGDFFGVHLTASNPLYRRSLRVGSAVHLDLDQNSSAPRAFADAPWWSAANWRNIG
jgi:hypothetical protein